MSIPRIPPLSQTREHEEVDPNSPNNQFIPLPRPQPQPPHTSQRNWDGVYELKNGGSSRAQEMASRALPPIPRPVFNTPMPTFPPVLRGSEIKEANPNDRGAAPLVPRPAPRPDPRPLISGSNGRSVREHEEVG